MARATLSYDPQNTANQIAESVFLLDLSLIRGGLDSVLSCIPDSRGIYAWYPKIQLPDALTATPDEFFAALQRAAETKHCPPRNARIPPLYQVTLEAYGKLPAAKSSQLRERCADPSFRLFLKSVLDYGIFFQRPLYIGKAASLTDRIKQHLAIGSPLNQRLQDAGIRIESCRLLYVTLPENLVVPEDEASDVDPSLDMSTFGNTPDETEDGPRGGDFLVEDLLSRLFQPSFTLRYG